MNILSVQHAGSAQESRSFQGPDYECRRCGATIFCLHSRDLRGGRDFYESTSGRLHRCRRLRLRPVRRRAWQGQVYGR